MPRLLFLLWAWPLPTPRDYYYWELSSSLLQSGLLGFGGEPSTEYEPLYPALLALLRWGTGSDVGLMMAAQVLIASAGAVYLFRLCLAVSGVTRTAWIAVLLYSLYPYYIRQSYAVIEVTLLTTLLLASLFNYLRIDSAGGAARAGLWWGVTMLARVATAPIVISAIAILATQRRWRHVTVMSLAAATVVMPLAIRNMRIDGSSLFSRSGVNLFKGNCDYSDRLIPAFSPDLIVDDCGPISRGDPAFDLLKATDREAGAYYQARAVAFITAEPWRVLRLKVLNAFYTLQPRIVPHYAPTDASRLSVTNSGEFVIEGVRSRSVLEDGAHAAAYSFIALASLVGAYRRRRTWARDAVLYAVVGCFVLVGVVYFPITRVRAPMDAVLMLLAACGLSPFTPSRFARRVLG